MDDEIIYSWCFNDVECFDSTPSAAIIILDKYMESFSSLRSQQRVPFWRGGGTDEARTRGRATRVHVDTLVAPHGGEEACE